MQTNDAMQRLLQANDWQMGSTPIPADLLSICESGFVREGSCVFLGHLYNRKGNGARNKFPDDVGYECFINHFHVDEHDHIDNLLICIELIRNLRRHWLDFSGSGTEKLRVIVSCDADGGCVFRFHKVRPFESWLASDLDSYQQEAILVQDIP